MANNGTGTVKWFNESKGFGFITPADGGKDLFAHINEVQGGRPLKEGQKVEYEVTQGKKGPKLRRFAVSEPTGIHNTH